MPPRAWPWLLLVVLAGCMDGKKEPPLARTPSLYTRLGGAPVIGKAVDDFIASLIADRQLKDVYQERGLPEVTRDLKHKLVEQIGEATGGPQQYVGRSIKEDYPDLKVTALEFGGLIDGLVQAVKDKKAAEQDRKDLQTGLARLRDQLVGQP